ncbi:MAG: hypothetical protein ACI8ZO_000849, partial [Flavobacteriales bacterium]
FLKRCSSINKHRAVAFVATQILPKINQFFMVLNIICSKVENSVLKNRIIRQKILGI